MIQNVGTNGLIGTAPKIYLHIYNQAHTLHNIHTSVIEGEIGTHNYGMECTG